MNRLVHVSTSLCVYGCMHARSIVRDDQDRVVCAFLLATFEARNAPPCFFCRQGLTLFAVPGCSDGRARNSLHPTLGARPELGQDDSIIDTIAPQISDDSRVVSHICHIPRVRDLASAHSSRLMGAAGARGRLHHRMPLRSTMHAWIGPPHACDVMGFYGNGWSSARPG